MYLYANTLYAKLICDITEGVLFSAYSHQKYIKYEVIMRLKSNCYKSFFLLNEICNFVEKVDICETGLRIYFSSRK